MGKKNNNKSAHVEIIDKFKIIAFKDKAQRDKSEEMESDEDNKKLTLEKSDRPKRKATELTTDTKKRKTKRKKEEPADEQGKNISAEDEQLIVQSIQTAKTIKLKNNLLGYEIKPVDPKISLRKIYDWINSFYSNKVKSKEIVIEKDAIVVSYNFYYNFIRRAQEKLDRSGRLVQLKIKRAKVPKIVPAKTINIAPTTTSMGFNSTTTVTMMEFNFTTKPVTGVLSPTSQNLGAKNTQQQKNLDGNAPKKLQEVKDSVSKNNKQTNEKVPSVISPSNSQNNFSFMVDNLLASQGEVIKDPMANLATKIQQQETDIDSAEKLKEVTEKNSALNNKQVSEKAQLANPNQTETSKSQPLKNNTKPLSQLSTQTFFSDVTTLLQENNKLILQIQKLGVKDWPVLNKQLEVYTGELVELAKRKRKFENNQNSTDLQAIATKGNNLLKKLQELKANLEQKITYIKKKLCIDKIIALHKKYSEINGNLPDNKNNELKILPSFEELLWKKLSELEELKNKYQFENTILNEYNKIAVLK